MHDNSAGKNVDAIGLKPGESADAQADKVNILIVDDLPEKLLVYRTILEGLGQNLITAQSGQEALKLVLKHDFAVILLDVNMPDTNGFETATLIRNRKKSAHTPIIFLTAFTDDLYAAQGYASGAVDYLPTPVMPEVLRAKVKVFIELHRMRRQAAMQAEESAKRKAAEESATRAAFVMSASEKLARSQDQDEILTRMVKAGIPFMGDMCFLWINDEESQADAILKWSWNSLPGEKNCEEAVPSWTALPWLKKAVNQSVGCNEVVATHAPVIEQGEYDVPVLGPVLVLPITLKGQTRGALVVARRKGQPGYTQGMKDTAGDFVARACIALEKAMLLERIQQADRRKDEFLGMLAHELRNPLGPIFNAVQIMHMMKFSEPRMENIRDIIDRQVKHMSRLIDDLLDATRLARGKFLLRKEQCNLNTIVQQTAEDYRSIFEASGLKLEVDIPEKPLWMVGDPTRLVQTVGNLLHNAHKFTNPGGMISVSLKEDSHNSAVITIRDTGIGIAADMLPSIFDVFAQAEQGLDRSRGGLGLGLALVKGLVQLHEGTVQASSAGLQKGTEFIMRFPLTATVEAVLQPPAAPQLYGNEKGRILVIEDNKDTAESARVLLSMEGYDVQVAYSGPTGIELALKHLPQIILCDIGLPGMDGYQVIRALRQHKELASVYVIALTGYGRDEDQRQAQEAGFDLHLTKPIDYNNLRRALTNFLIRKKTQMKNHLSAAFGHSDWPTLQNQANIH